jgi:hypothetical protein
VEVGVGHHIVMADHCAVALTPCTADMVGVSRGEAAATELAPRSNLQELENLRGVNATEKGGFDAPSILLDSHINHISSSWSAPMQCMKPMIRGTFGPKWSSRSVYQPWIDRSCFRGIPCAARRNSESPDERGKMLLPEDFEDSPRWRWPGFTNQSMRNGNGPPRPAQQRQSGRQTKKSEGESLSLRSFARRLFNNPGKFYQGKLVSLASIPYPLTDRLNGFRNTKPCTS